MNSNRNPSSVIRSSLPESNILSATGLSRAGLRHMFSERGLFGAQSALSTLEQAGLYAELRLPAGAVPPTLPTKEIPNHWRIALIRSVAGVVLRRDTRWYGPQVKLARRFGVKDDVISEVTRTVQAAMLVYGSGAPVQHDVGLATVTPVHGANDRLAMRATA